jgi:hypothetical protein
MLLGLGLAQDVAQPSRSLRRFTLDLPAQVSSARTYLVLHDVVSPERPLILRAYDRGEARGLSRFDGDWRPRDAGDAHRLSCDRRYYGTPALVGGERPARRLNEITLLHG